MISISCAATLDGIASAAILFRYATLKKKSFQFTGCYRLSELTNHLTKLASRQKQILFFLDVPFAEEHVNLLQKISKNNKILYWSGPETSIKPPATYIDTAPKTSSAELVTKRFLPKDTISEKIAQQARDVKFWKLKETHAAKLSDLITFGFPPFEIIKSLARGIFWNDRFEAYHKEYHQKKLEALNNMKKTLTIKNCLNTNIAFARVSSIVTTADAGQHVLDTHAGVDVAVVLYKDGTISFRRRNSSDIDVKALAELFGGGGHPYAAGARLGKNITAENYSETVHKLDQAFKKALIK